MCSVRLDYSRMLLFLAGFITLISSRPAQLLPESCDWTVWDNTWEGKGVWNVHMTCHEGHVSWRNPYGALRVTLSPETMLSRPFQLCFKATAHFNIGKISVEQEGSRGGGLQPLVVLSESQPAMPREFCLPPSHTPVILYVEALATGLNGLTIGHIELDYDMEYLTGHAPTSDDLEECRPCTDKELLHAVCTSDFVIAGSIESASQLPQFGETELALQVHKVYRQKHKLFTTTKSADLNTVNMSPVSTYAPRVVKNYCDGHVIVPHKCSVHGGAGRFLFLGKIRLKRALLKCAPRLEMFLEMWSRASQRGQVMCQFD